MFIISNQNVKNLAYENKEFLNQLIDTCDLGNEWVKEKFFELETKKCFVRGELRYSEVSTKLLNEIVNTSILNKKINTMNFYTRIYPMIHMKNDRSEESGLHFDQNDNNDMFTCWLTITDNEYSPISILNFQNKYLKKILSKFRFPQILLNEIKPHIGDLNFWNGHFLHKGNFNNSKKISCAYQMKFSKFKYIYEYSKYKNERYDHNTNISSEKIDVNYKKFNELIKSLDKINLKNDPNKLTLDIKKILKELYPKGDSKISFSMSVLSQRILTQGKKFHLDESSKKALVYDLVSILLGSENLVSLDRICKKKFNYDFYESLYNSDYLNCIPKESHEWKKILKKNKIKIDKDE
ncbi:hypothetical protein AKH21_01680 [Pelagibacteraceae bacterium GOM-A5]|nr:hypothetical protein AKH21_01680 [Pelagibacteraceae bacterium GOM-A5]